MRNRLCKIVATVGPASSSPSMLRLIHNAGVDIFRLNMSHGGHDKLRTVVQSIRDIEKTLAMPLAIFADLQGPKIRTGAFAGGSIKLKYGAEYRLTLSNDAADEDTIPIPHKELLDVLEPGDILKLDDGKLQITVTEKTSRHLVARADTPGTLSNRKGINVPGRSLPISAMTEKDREDLAFALELSLPDSANLALIDAS